MVTHASHPSSRTLAGGSGVQGQLKIEEECEASLARATWDLSQKIFFNWITSDLTNTRVFQGRINSHHPIYNFLFSLSIYLLYMCNMYVPRRHFLIFYSLLNHLQVPSSMKSIGEAYVPFTKTSSQRHLMKDCDALGILWELRKQLKIQQPQNPSLKVTMLLHSSSTVNKPYCFFL